jgi:hypothetical protein
VAVQRAGQLALGVGRREVRDRVERGQDPMAGRPQADKGQGSSTAFE